MPPALPGVQGWPPRSMVSSGPSCRPWRGGPTHRASDQERRERRKPAAGLPVPPDRGRCSRSSALGRGIRTARWPGPRSWSRGCASAAAAAPRRVLGRRRLVRVARTGASTERTLGDAQRCVIAPGCGSSLEPNTVTAWGGAGSGRECDRDHDRILRRGSGDPDGGWPRVAHLRARVDAARC